MGRHSPNEPVTARQVQQVIGDEEIAQIADKLGVSHEAAQAIAEVLPQVVDRASPDGQLPPGAGSGPRVRQARERWRLDIAAN
jgi:uncharacterized protein YidB (DUF937 family)